MNFLHYLYAKGETIFELRLGGRGLIVAPVWMITLFFGHPLFPQGLGKLCFMIIYLCWLAILVLITHLILPKKNVKLKAWVRKYRKRTNFWAYLYLFSPIIILLTYTIIEFH